MEYKTSERVRRNAKKYRRRHREQVKAFNKAYKEKNREKLKAYRKEYNRKNRERQLEYRRRPEIAERARLLRFKREDHKPPHCAFCGRLLTSRNVKRKHWKYCAECHKDPGVKRYLRNLYMARTYAKKRGHELPSLTIAEDII